MEREINSLMWYHGQLSHNESEEIIVKEYLKNCCRKRIFLVRDCSQRKHFFVLSCFDKKLKHFPITQHGGDAFFSIKNGKIIHGLDELIEAFKQNDDESVTCDSLKPFIFVKGKLPPVKFCKTGRSKPLHFAVKRNDLRNVVHFLVKSKSCIDDKDEDGRTALHLACISDDINLEISRFLIEKNASMLFRDAKGKTPLIYAIENNLKEIVKLMIQKDKNVIQSKVSETHETPLHVASRLGNDEIVKVLLDNNAAMFPVTKTGKLPIDLAAENRHENVVIHLSRRKRSKTINQCRSHGKMTRSVAQTLLMNKQKMLKAANVNEDEIAGLFLVRFSEKINRSVVTMLQDDEIKNYEIFLTKGHFHFIGGPWHRSFEDLIDYYREFADGLPSKLTISLEPPPQLYDTLINFSNPEYSLVLRSYNETNDNLCRHCTGKNYCEVKEKVGDDYDWLKKSTPVAVESCNDDFFIDESQLAVSPELLGQGTFGTVNKGILVVPGKSSHVAVKTLHGNDNNNFCSFLREAGIMMQFNNPFIVKMIGIVKGPPMKIVQELQKFGSLINYLKTHSDEISSRDINIWAAQIADGMSYLESKKFVHRDLAARNILLASKTHAKISDFGLSRTISVKNGIFNGMGEKMLPVRWFAPECFNCIYTHASDVWSFGVTIWEAYTKGLLPYESLGSVYEIFDFLQDEKRLEKPANCPDEIYITLLRCWSQREDERPNFQELRKFFVTCAPIYENINLHKS